MTIATALIAGARLELTACAAAAAAPSTTTDLVPEESYTIPLLANIESESQLTDFQCLKIKVRAVNDAIVDEIIDIN